MNDESLVPNESPAEILAAALTRTPARLMIGRSGPALKTQTWLTLRADHAAARDAVHHVIYMHDVFCSERIQQWGMIELATAASSRADYLKRPDHGRRLDESSREIIRKQMMPACDIQLVVGDGLSVAAVKVQALPLMELLQEQFAKRGWSVGRPLFIRNCRVGVMNDLGDLIDVKVIVLLIGERPGLATAESLSAYLAYRPCAGQTDANRNLVSNIHSQGLSIEEAAERIQELIENMLAQHTSGVALK